MPIVLTITDNQDGTGAVATIAGSAGGSTNTVNFQQESNDGAWTTGGTRTGDGTVALDLLPGYFWGAVFSVSGGNQSLSNVVRFVVTEGVDAVHNRILSAVQAETQAIGLADLPSERVYRGMSLDDKNSMFPSIWISTEGVSESMEGGTNERDDIGYPVAVVIANRNNKDMKRELPRFLLWRQRIIGRFRSQRLAGVPEQFNVKVEPYQVIDSRHPWFDFIASAFVLRFICRLQRRI